MNFSYKLLYLCTSLCITSCVIAGESSKSSVEPKKSLIAIIMGHMGSDAVEITGQVNGFPSFFSQLAQDHTISACKQSDMPAKASATEVIGDKIIQHDPMSSVLIYETLNRVWKAHTKKSDQK